MCCYIIIALIVLHAIFGIGKEACLLWAVKIDLISAVVVAGQVIAIPVTTTDHLWGVAPFVSDVIQQMVVAGHVIQAALVTLPIH